MNQKKNDEKVADDAIQRIMDSLSTNTGRIYDKYARLYMLGPDNGILRNIKNTAIDTAIRSESDKTRRVHLRAMQSILDNAKLKQIVNATIEVIKAKQSGAVAV